MAQCPSCRSRKGKRTCPALNGLICPKCCGTKRIVEIRCPADCRYLAHERYQGERLLGRESALQRRYVEASRSGEGAFQTLVLVDMHLADFLRSNPDFPLPALREGLAYLRRLASPLEAVEATSTALEIWLRERIPPMIERRMIDRDRLREAAETTQAFFEEHVTSEADVRSYVRFVDAFVGDTPRPEIPTANGGDDGGTSHDESGLIVPGR